VALHPSLAPLLAEARALGPFLEGGRPLLETPLGDEVLAYYLVTHRLGPHALPAGLQAAFTRIEARLDVDPALRARCEALSERRLALEGRGDAVSHFERVTGHVLEGPAVGGASRAEDRPAWRRPPLRLLSEPFQRWGIAATVAFVALYGVLLLFSEVSRSDLQRLAQFQPEMLVVDDVETPALRSEERIGDQSMHLFFLEALAEIRAAQSSILGLFPHYDAEHLARAVANLEQIVTHEQRDTYLYLESSFYLGKLYLAQEDVPRARAALQSVIAGGGERLDEASALLIRLEE